MSDVFVSYKAEDRRRVEPLVHALEAAGVSVWWDAQIGGGDRWREKILDNLGAAHRSRRKANSFATKRPARSAGTPICQCASTGSTRRSDLAKRRRLTCAA